MGMSDETLNTKITIDAPPVAVFAILADPSTHRAIDGTGWVRECLDGTSVDAVGQTFLMAMYHPNHPDGRYEILNRVVAFEPDRVIAWEPGQQGPDGYESWGGWIWRYDLSPNAGGTDVTLTYDWSAVPEEPRKEIEFPPFPPSHLENSLRNLAELATG